MEIDKIFNNFWIYNLLNFLLNSQFDHNNQMSTLSVITIGG